MTLAAEAFRIAALTEGQCRPQAAALNFAVTGDPRALDHYFPLARVLAPRERDDFDALVGRLAGHAGFGVRLLGAGGVELSDIPGGARHIVAGHLAETFFYRRDILERLLGGQTGCTLYTTPAAFAADGGAAGGSFDPRRGVIQLLLARLYEGFDGAWPGVAPFLHEFGHLLDFFDAGTGRLGASQGLLPGLSPSDGVLYTPEARRLFLRGKRLERDRYLAVSARRPGPRDPLPIGHPYVFQNDTEFCAGYFEMFFRNPHHMAAHNPDLHAGYVALFGYDTRRAWPEDFRFYIEQNEAFYRSGARVGVMGITME